MQKNKWLDILIVSLVILNVGFFILERTNDSELKNPIQIPEEKFLSKQPAVQPEPEKVVSIQFFGDMMLDRNVAKVMATSGLDYLFEKARGEENLFRNTDLLIANLEGPFAPKRISTGKTIAFRFDPALAVQLKEYGFDGFSLANNHSYDMGAKNVTFTRETLKNNDLAYFGDELKEGSAYTWIAEENLPFKIAFLGLHNTYHELDREKITEAIGKAKIDGAKVVIANVHWGEEYKTSSNKKQQTLARWLVDSGVDLVIGHHPHVVQEAEIYKNKPIFYSLGNFIFDQYFSRETQTGISVVLKYSKDGQAQSAELVPFVGINSQVVVMTSTAREAFLTAFQKNSRLDGRSLTNGVIGL